MGRYSNWTMVHETISRAVTSNSVSLKVICTELSKVSFLSQDLIRPNPATTCKSIRLWKCVHKFKDETSKQQNAHCEMCGGGPRRVLILRSITFFCHNEHEKSYREALRFHRPSSAQSSRNSGLQRRCPRPIYFLWRVDRQEHASEVFISGDITWHKMITHFPCNYLSLLLHWRWTMETQFVLCHKTPIHQQKKKKEKKRGLDLDNWLLPDNTYPIYCSVLLNFLARYLADALLGILTMDSSLP